MQDKNTSEERLMAALAHASSMLIGMGLFAPVLIWSSYREKSKHLAFQSLQALGYQVLFFTFVLLISLILIPFFFIFTFPLIVSATQNGSTPPLFIFVFEIIYFAVVFGGYFLGSIIGAVLTYQGKPFYYPFFGKRLAKYVDYVYESEDPIDDEKQFHWVAAMGHASVIIQTWGILISLFVWINEKGKNKFLHFQSLQTLIFQGIMNLGFIFGMILYVFSAFGFIGFAGIMSQNGGDPPVEILLIFGILILCILSVIFLSLPLFHIFGQWAAYRILKGDDYKYPLLGKWLEKRLGSRE